MRRTPSFSVSPPLSFSAPPREQSAASVSRGSYFFRQRFDVFHRDDASDVGVGGGAFDHRGKNLAAELDELGHARLGHGGDALAPADHAGHLLDEEAAYLVRLADRGGSDVGVERDSRVG